ncbi:AfsR/SARP family transcriptional regulator [Streptomyces sp. NPDC002588]|uniref:AfsR/SARP family transcriptional regulator n=1 Tax=Streptomyces sp. NPDC002588 TaxID=3154419 RepID=UPI0033297504
MEIRLLGQLTARVNHRSIVPSAAKPRQVLSLLALHPGRVVTVSTLLEELWGDNPPRSALTTLQTYVLQLRRLIAEALGDSHSRAAKEILATRHGGYSLVVPPEAVDVQPFRRLIRSGRTAYELGDDRTAATMLGDALDLWLGTALLDVPHGRVLELEVSSLENARMVALEQRIEADLRLGRHAELLSELFTLAARHPMHENLYAHLMTALYRSGHTARALEAFQQLRRVLIAELGLEPSPRVQRIHRAILSGDPALDPPLPAVHGGVGLLVPARSA